MRGIVGLLYVLLLVLSPVEEAVRPREVVLAAVGDNLIHDVIYRQARLEDGSYDFAPLYDRVSRVIGEADLSFINQETPMVEGRPPDGYPMFNTPVEMAEDLVKTGFDIAGLSNNHMLDQGAEGLAQTAALLGSTDGMTVTGLHGPVAILEAEGIRFAFVAITQHLNVGRPSGETADLIVTTGEEARVEALIAEGKSKADVVVVSVHWGDENSPKPNEYQKSYARKLAGWGADLVIGTHPHVLQPVEWMGEEGEDKTLVLYSLGNFVSAQLDPANLITVIAKIRFRREIWGGPVTIAGLECVPVVTHYDSGFRGLVPILRSDYTDELARFHRLRSQGQPWSLEYIDRVLEAAVGEYLAK